MLVKLCEVGGGEHCVELGTGASGAAMLSAAAAATKTNVDDIRLVYRGRRVERSQEALSLAQGERVVLFRRRRPKAREEPLRRYIKDEIEAALRQYASKAEGSSLSPEEAADLRKRIETQLEELIGALFMMSAVTGGSLDLAGALGRIGEDEEEDEEDLPEADLPEAELSLPDDQESSMIVDSAEFEMMEGAEEAAEAGQAEASAAPEDSSGSAQSSSDGSASSGRGDSVSAEVDLTVDEASLQQLVEMGFSSEAARKALLLNQSNTEQALNWLLEHSGDEDINDPLTPQQLEQLAAAQRQFTPNAQAQQQLMDMGFPPDDVVQALRACDNNYEAACAWLLGDRVEVPRRRPAGPGSMLQMFCALTQGSLLKAIKHNPEMEQCMRSPKTLETLKYITKNPKKVQQFVNDPLVGSIISEIFRIIRTAFASR